MDDLVERLLWHVEQVMGPISTKVCENPGDDDRSVLTHNFAAEIRSLREQVAQERAGRMTAIENARYRVCKRIAESRAGSYLIAGYLRGELDDSAAIQEALMAIERHEDKEPRA